MSLARADVISVNFIGGQSGTTSADTSKGGAVVTGTAGAVAAANWNNEGVSQQTTPVAIMNSAGVPSALLSYSAPDNSAASGSAPGRGTNAALMNGLSR